MEGKFLLPTQINDENVSVYFRRNSAKWNVDHRERARGCTFTYLAWGREEVHSKLAVNTFIL